MGPAIPPARVHGNKGRAECLNARCICPQMPANHRAHARTIKRKEGEAGGRCGTADGRSTARPLNCKGAKLGRACLKSKGWYARGLYAQDPGAPACWRVNMLALCAAQRPDRGRSEVGGSQSALALRPRRAQQMRASREPAQGCTPQLSGGLGLQCDPVQAGAACGRRKIKPAARQIALISGRASLRGRLLFKTSSAATSRRAGAAARAVIRCKPCGWRYWWCWRRTARTRSHRRRGLDRHGRRCHRRRRGRDP